MYSLQKPFNTGHLKVSDLHSVYFEESGKKDGKPVIFLHGGPGGGASGSDTVYFDPEVYRIVIMDQRGAGKSTPSAELIDNTTWDLVADIERLRESLSIDKWVVFGGSWGSTLALAYAQTHPAQVKGLILRGIFTLRRSELEFFYQNGTSHLFPEAWDEYIAPIPEDERNDMMAAYYKRLTSEDKDVRVVAARAWSRWEMSTSRLRVSQDDLDRAESDDWALQFARIECAYFVNGGWMRDGQLLETQSIDKIRHIPTKVAQGRYDVVCPATTAWALKKAFPESELVIIPDAGHSAKEDGTKKQLKEFADSFKSL